MLSYSSNGAQINRPEDGEIAQSILENLEPWPNAWEESQRSREYFDEEGLQEILVPFQRRVKEYAVSDEIWLSINGEPLTKATQTSTVSEVYPPRQFVYTPMHGVGAIRIGALLREMGLYENKEYTIVPQQAQPDPNFSTVKFPNPEEAGALDLAIQVADEQNKTLIFANDPDADRFAVAEKVE